MPTDGSCHYEPAQEIDFAPTLIEGLPGAGLVASIVVDRVTEALGLERVGTIHSEHFPPVVTFHDGLVEDLVRVYAGEDSGVMTLQSATPIPSNAYRALSSCVLDGLAPTFERAIFLAGAPAQSEEARGKIVGLATQESVQTDLEAAGIQPAEGWGVIGGVTGALMEACHAEEVPAACLVVTAHPKLPDPGAARTVIEEALEPLIGFEIDTAQLQEQAEEIAKQKAQVAQQLQQAGSGQQESAGEDAPMMFR